MRIVKKYEFNTKSTASKYINELWVEDEEGNKSRKTYQVEQTDEEGNVVMVDKPYIAHPVILGNIVLEQGQYDEEGNELVAPVLSNKFHVDVLWESKVEERWNTYEVEVEAGTEVHRFL